MRQDVILSVEDSDADFQFIEMALQDCLPDSLIHRASDGEKAIELFKEAKSIDGRLPDLVILDRNLPRKDGFEVLAYLFAEKITEQVPVVLFTSAATQTDRRKAFELGARNVVLKPTNLGDLLDRLKEICAEIRK